MATERKNTFLLKRSNVPGKIPSPGDLKLGELALNTADVKLYTSGTTENDIVQIGWDRISRTGDTVTGDYIFNGDVSISGTSNLNIVTASTISNVEYIDFDINGNTQQEGRILWDDESKTLQLGLRGGNTLEVGQKNVLFVVNDDSTQINKGEAVYVTSITGGRVAVKKSIATSTLTSKAIGIALENIPSTGNKQGYIVTNGVLENINTLGFQEGEIIWLSDIVAGGITTDLPTKPNCRTRIGTVLNENATEGKIYINIQYSPRINSICDIDTSGQVNGDLLVYNNVTGIWESSKSLNGDYIFNDGLTISGLTEDNALDEILVVDTDGVVHTRAASSLGGGGGSIGTGTTNYVSKWTGTNTQGNSQIFDTGTSIGIGTTTPESIFNISQNGSPQLYIDGYSDTTFTAPQLVLRRSRGSQDTSTSLLGGNLIGSITARGHDGNGIGSGSRAAIIFAAAQNWTSSANGTNIRISTTENGTTTLTERIRILDNGNVGINTTTPNAQLHVNSSSALATHNVARIGNLNVKGNGFVGIGTTNPNSKLQVNGNIRTRGDETITGNLLITNNNTGQSSFIWMDSSDKMRIDNSVISSRDIILNGEGNGKVGIGTDSPTHKLSVSGDTKISDKLTIGDIDSTYKLNISGSTGSLIYDGNAIRNESRGADLIVSTKPDLMGGIGIRETPDNGPGISMYLIGEDAPITQPYNTFGEPRDAALFATSRVNNLNILNNSGADSNGNIRFYAGSSGILSNLTPTMHLQGSGSTKGFVGIGTTSTTNKLTIEGDAGVGIDFGTSTIKNTISTSNWHNGLILSNNLKYNGTNDPAINMNYINGDGDNQRGGTLFFTRANSETARGLYFYTAPNSTGAGDPATLTEQFRVTPTSGFFRNKLSVGLIGSDQSALLNIRAQGSLSSDEVLKVRNNANTIDSFKVLGNGRTEFRANAVASGAEEIARFQIEDSASALVIQNFTNDNGVFVPTIVGDQKDNRGALSLIGRITSENDTGTTPILSMSTRIGNTNPVAVRPLFRFRNFTTDIFQINADGNFGIGVVPTQKLDVDGKARIRTIDNGTGDFLTTDSNGVITNRTPAQVLTDIGVVERIFNVGGPNIFILKICRLDTDVLFRKYTGNIKGYRRSANTTALDLRLNVSDENGLNLSYNLEYTRILSGNVEPIEFDYDGNKWFGLKISVTNESQSLASLSFLHEEKTDGINFEILDPAVVSITNELPYNSLHSSLKVITNDTLISGNVGINTTPPNAQLHVNSSSALSTHNVARIGDLNVKGNGFVGIGTTSPTAKLDVNVIGSDVGPWLLLRGGGSVLENTALELRDNGTASNNRTNINFTFTNSGILGSQIYSINPSPDASSGAHLVLQTFNDDSGTVNANQLFLNRNGNVGINTTTPNAQLHVNSSSALASHNVARIGSLRVNGAGDVFNPGNSGSDSNTFFGINSGRNTTGLDNTFLGQSAGRDNTTASRNVFIGVNSGRETTTGGSNVGVGTNSGIFNDGARNIFLGEDAGRRTSNGSELTRANHSIFIGYDTRATGDNQGNQIVIGDQAIGIGSNTVVLGNNNIVKTALKGDVGIGTTQPSEKLDVDGKARIRTIDTDNTLNEILVTDSNGVIHKRDITPSYGHFYVTNNTTNTLIAQSDTYQLITGIPSLDIETSDFILNNPADGEGTLLLDPDGDGGFENGTSFSDNGWTVVNGSQTNQWYVGSPGADSGDRGAYISNDGGNTNAYNVNSTSITHFYRDITVPPGTSLLTLKFKVRVQGEGPSSPFDYLRVNIASTSQTPTAGTLPPGTILDNYRLLGNNFVEITVNLTQASILTSSDIRLIFTWVNDASLGTQPPASVDNIEIKSFGGACCFRYIGTEEKVFNANVHLNVSSASANQRVTIAIIKNADASNVKSSMHINTPSTNTRYMISTQDTFRLEPNDTITPVIKNNISTAALLVEDVNFIVKQI